MAAFLTDLRRSVSEFAIRQTIAATGLFPPAIQRRTGRSLVSVAGSIPMLQARALANMRLALGSDVPSEAAQLYFRRIAWWLSNTLTVFHHGIDASPIAEEVAFDDTFAVVDEAIALGRGAVITSPHWFGHELTTALINRRHPITLVVRQGTNAEKMARKLKWYSALGVDVVVRPRGASAIKDAAAYLKVLKQNRILAVTPDLLTSQDAGVGVEIFGRGGQIFAGAFAIASIARAPLLRPFPRWQSDSRLIVSWASTDLPSVDQNRTAVIAGAAQDWCRWFEGKLRSRPQDWLFWLDKRWSRFLRATPPQSPIS
jgi:lauroyl/myristoyl acyltransferase